MDIVSPADRALIDTAIAAGRIRKIPRGVSGIDPEQVTAGKKSVWPCLPTTGEQSASVVAKDRCRFRLRERQLAKAWIGRYAICGDLE